MPIMWALANPKIGEREVLAAMLEVDARLVTSREGILLVSDKGFASKPFEKALAELPNGSWPWLPRSGTRPTHQSPDR